MKNITFFLLFFSLSLGTGLCQSIYTVNSTDDLGDVDLADLRCADEKGKCTLRAAIENANKSSKRDKVHFQIPGKGPYEIILNDNLPKITEPIELDATTQPSYISGKPMIILNGKNILLITNRFNEDISPIGFHLASNSGGSVIKGFVIGGFGYANDAAQQQKLVYFHGQAIFIKTEKNIIQSNYIGLSVDGNSRFSNVFGIGIHASKNLIGGDKTEDRNVISGNWRSGILGYSHNVIKGNFIGTTADGNSALGNKDGITSVVFSQNNIIERNLISGNNNGIYISGDKNYIRNNRIGTNVKGTHSVSNQIGILLNDARENDIGEGNLISGNNVGIIINSNYLETDLANNIWGNFIGTGPCGLGVIPNDTGIHIYSSNGNLIGGANPARRNIISGNIGAGIKFSEANKNVVTGNFIGSDLTGKKALPNSIGIEFFGEPGLEFSLDNMINENLISGNIEDGVRLDYAGGNSIVGNNIGTGIDGIIPLPNAGNGITLTEQTYNNCIGSTEPYRFNMIAHNNENGIFIYTAESSKVLPQRNQILQNNIFRNKNSNLYLSKNQNLKADK